MASDNSFQSQVLPGTKAVMPKEKGSGSSPRGHDGPDAGGRPRPARMRSPGCGAGRGGVRPAAKDSGRMATHSKNERTDSSPYPASHMKIYSRRIGSRCKPKSTKLRAKAETAFAPALTARSPREQAPEGARGGKPRPAGGGRTPGPAPASSLTAPRTHDGRPNLDDRKANDHRQKNGHSSRGRVTGEDADGRCAATGPHAGG